MIGILIYILIFYFGLMLGYLLKMWIHSRSEFNGAILISKEHDKTVYSLVLDDYPEKIEFKKEVILKVVASTESPNRE
jgi:hypothetical protein